ncbi:MAG: hypothetical protein KDA37_06885 [Planctomycetales bacterium]|nr:hypothetical protein [Planctomycetales bacterium]
MSQKTWLAAGAAAIMLAMHASSSHAAVIVSNSLNVAPAGGAVHDMHDPSVAGTPDLLTASSTDLIQGLLPVVTYTGGSGSTTNELSAGESAWTDGSLKTVYGEGGSGGDAVDHAAYGTVTGTVGGADIDTFVTYDLGAKHDLSAIDVYLGWNDSGRDDSSFNALVSADNVTFTQIAAYDKGGDNTGQITVPVTNLHSIVDDGGASIASGVRYVQLQFTDADNGFAGMVELDVFGTQVPEPLAAGLVGLVGLVLAGLRRRD